MNRTLLMIVGAAIAAVALFYAFNSYIYNEKQAEVTVDNNNIEVTPVSHATMVLNWGNKIIYTDPVGGAEAFSGTPEPDFILVTDVHGDHFSAETLQAVSKDKTVIVVPGIVEAQLPDPLAGKVVVLDNGQVASEQGFNIQAIPMYNLPESEESFHIKGRGNGYVVETNGKRVYVSGDTGDIPEMRSLENIDLAFVAMNLPYTMSVESAADAVLDFMPKQVYPYHYRTPDGFSDVAKFKELVNAGNPDVEVVLADWYPQP